MISYIVDENGNKTHAIVPIKQWTEIEAEMLLNQDKGSSYPEEHISNTIHFLKENRNIDVTLWKKKYELYFNYYNKLDLVDFMVLYLYRSGFFGIVFDDEAYEKVDMNTSNLFLEHLSLSNIKYVTKEDKSLTWQIYKEVRDKIDSTTEQEFLLYFHSRLKFTNSSVDYFKEQYKRVHRNAERDRLFVYDLYILFGNKHVHVPKKYLFNELEKTPAQYIAKYLYKENISQVYRAGKEAAERVAVFNN